MENESSKTGSERSSNVPYLLKEYDHLPIYVVEYHNEALPYIYQNIGAKYLPISGNTMIHLDSHPDLGVPFGVAASVCFDKHRLFDILSIENWIMPGAYSDIFKNVVWIKPPWATQIPEGCHVVKLGEDKTTKEIKVTSPLQYFVGEAVYSREENLNNVKELNLEVVTLQERLDEQGNLPHTRSKMQKYLKDGDKFILDIDLDFFSTKNPFLDIYVKADTYSHLKKLYAFDGSRGSTDVDADTLTKLTEARLKQLDQLKTVFRYLEENISLDEAPEDITSLPCFPGVKELYDKLEENYPDEDIEWMIVHDGGCTIDENELPHHVTQRPQLEHYLNEVFPQFLDMLPGRPTVITISRSTEDDYCPQEDVEYIQETVLAILKKKFENVKVTLDYCGDQDEEMPVLVNLPVSEM